MSVRMTRDKMNRILDLVGNIKSKHPDEHTQTMVTIVERCIDIIDDIQEDLEFYKEEYEKVKFALEDKRFEQQRNRRGGNPFR